MSTPRGLFFVGAMLAAATACTAIIGTRDLSYDPTAEGGASSGNPPGTPPPGTPPPGSGDGGEGGTCNADLQSDPKNCGRCGRDCLGAKCTMGACEPITLAMGFNDLNYIALDATNVYLTSYGDGKVWKVPKDGSLQQTAIATTAYARGLAIDGTTLYWASNDYIYNGTDQVGGIYKCTLPDCMAPTLVSVVDQPLFPVESGGVVYFGSLGDGRIHKSLADGGSAVVTTAGQPTFLALDATHVYFTSSSNDMLRTLIAGDGGTERIGPLNGNSWGYVQLDATRAYWAYADSDFTSHVLGVDKANVAMTPTVYSTADDKNSLGVALDATSIYWSDLGTFTNDAMPVSHNDGMIRTCPKAGCAASGPITLAKGLTQPLEIAVDDQAVYWAEFVDINNSILKKVAKP